MRINRNNIADFISELHIERHGNPAPEHLIYKWVNLPEDEIDFQLSKLFQSWGKNESDKERAIQRYLQNTTIGNEPTTEDSRNINPTEPIDKPKSNALKYVLFTTLALLLIGLGFVGYRYLQYSSLNYIYAITDNISVRDNEGKIVARMDLFDRDGNKNNSHSRLRALDNQVHYLSYEGSDKEYPTRRVLMDSTNFWDYLTKNDVVSRYVNTNYVVNDKTEFEFYQTAFKAIQDTKSDNDELIAIYRKIIVGSMANSDGFEGKYLENNTRGLSVSQIKNTSAYVIQQIKPNQHYVIIAALNDGNYYRFEGDIKINEFYKPIIINTIKDDIESPLKGVFRFITQKGSIYLYDVLNKKATDYELLKDVMGKNIAFKYNAPIIIDTIPIIDTTSEYILEMGD